MMSKVTSGMFHKGKMADMESRTEDWKEHRGHEVARVAKKVKEDTIITFSGLNLVK